jgi:trans-aconitate methyltransferase
MKQKWATPWIALPLLLLACSLLQAPALWAQKKPVRAPDIEFVPTPHEVVEVMLRLADVKKDDIVYDLGCGDGRIVIAAAQKFGAAKGTGIDIDPARIKEANANATDAKVNGKVRFIQQNLFDADFHDASVVTLYLLPDINLRLRPKLLKELRVGSRIVSHQFDMGDWQPDKKIEVGWRSVYMWTVTEKAKKEFGGAAN